MAEVVPARELVVDLGEEKRWKFCLYHYKGVLIILIPIICSPLLIIEPYNPFRFLYTTICVYLYFLFNVMPVGAIAFLFIIFLPPLGIETSKLLCTSHYGDIIFMFVMSSIIALLMDVTKLSERIGMLFISLLGGRIRIMQIGFMVITGLLSIFLPSTYSAAIMMKVAQAILNELHSQGKIKMFSDEEPYELHATPYPSWPALGIYLTVAYSATLGDWISPFVEPNIVLTNSYSNKSLITYCAIMIGPMIIMFIVLFIWIQLIFFGLFRSGSAIGTELNEAAAAGAETKEAARKKRTELGPMSCHLISAIIVLAITTILLFLVRPIFFKGITDLSSVAVKYSALATLMCVAAFMLPANYMFFNYCICRSPKKKATAPSLINWKTIHMYLSWGHLFYLACGYGCAYAAKVSNFNQIIFDGIRRRFNAGASDNIIKLFSALFGLQGTILSPADGCTEYTSKLILGQNVFVNEVMAIPWLMALHVAFLLPSSAGSNAIVAGWGNIRTWQFVIGGSVPTLLGFLVVYMFALLFSSNI